jgi:hypothetical protein
MGRDGTRGLCCTRGLAIEVARTWACACACACCAVLCAQEVQEWLQKQRLLPSDLPLGSPRKPLAQNAWNIINDRCGGRWACHAGAHVNQLVGLLSAPARRAVCKE